MTVQPHAKKVPATRTFHGDTVTDDYAWLADTTDPEVIDYLTAHNDYTAAATAPQESLRTQIFGEIKEHTQETDMSVPQRRGQFWYYARTEEGKQYPMQCRAPIADEHDWTPPVLTTEPLPGEQVFLDLNVLAQDHEYIALGAASVSADGALIAYSVDTSGDERFTLRIREIATGTELPDVIEGVFYGATWAPDSRYLFYTTVDQAWRADSIWRHQVGAQSPDVRVVYEADQRFGVGIGLTRSDKYLMVSASSTLSSEVLVLDADDPTGQFRVLVPRQENVDYSVEHAVLAGQDRFLFLHNRTGINFELAAAPVDAPQDWTVLVPHRDDVRLEFVDAYAQVLALGYRRGGLPRLALAATQANPDFAEWDPGEPLANVGPAANPEWDAPRIRLAFESFVTPATVLELDPATGEQRVLKQLDVPGYDPSRYRAQQVWVTARDGSEVPVSLVSAATLPTGPNPVLLYGYGSYEATLDPWFSVARLSLLDRGVVFAVAHVRGGGELGRAWYDSGKQLAKNNTFTDFVDVAQYLVGSGLTAPDRLVAMGGSAGGLLVGAVANLAPELFSGIVADVPFVDPLTSILDPSLPLTVGEWDEWGNPLEHAQVYEYMLAYSPYENVAARPYPAMLVTTSLNDTRVLPTEPAKWVAKLLEYSTSGNPVLLKTEMVAGHAGVSGRYAKWRETAFEYAWVLTNLGATDRL